MYFHEMIPITCVAWWWLLREQIVNIMTNSRTRSIVEILSFEIIDFTMKVLEFVATI